MKKTIVLFLAFLSLGASNCSKHTVRPDAYASAIEAGDYTALIEGCGNQLVPGYTYCRKFEGDAANDSLYFVAPPTKCLPKDPETGADRTSCVFIEIFSNEGEPNLSLSFPLDKDRVSKTRIEVKWSQLLNRNDFQRNDRGFWPFRTTFYWIDPQGRENKSVMEGEIRLRVIVKQVSRTYGTFSGSTVSYVPLHNMSEDPNFVWKWVDNGLNVKMTTGARNYVSQRKSMGGV